MAKEENKIGAKTAEFLLNPTSQVLTFEEIYSLFVNASTKRNTTNNLDQIFLVQSAKMGNGQATSMIFEKYKRLVYSLVNGNYLPGGSHDDLYQEGLIGLWVATRDFDPLLGIPFASFAELCIHRRI